MVEGSACTGALDLIKLSSSGRTTTPNLINLRRGPRDRQLKSVNDVQAADADGPSRYHLQIMGAIIPLTRKTHATMKMPATLNAIMTFIQREVSSSHLA